MENKDVIVVASCISSIILFLGIFFALATTWTYFIAIALFVGLFMLSVVSLSYCNAGLNLTLIMAMAISFWLTFWFVYTNAGRVSKVAVNHVDCIDATIMNYHLFAIDSYNNVVSTKDYETIEMFKAGSNIVIEIEQDYNVYGHPIGDRRMELVIRSNETN